MHRACWARGSASLLWVILGILSSAGVTPAWSVGRAPVAAAPSSLRLCGVLSVSMQASCRGTAGVGSTSNGEGTHGAGRSADRARNPAVVAGSSNSPVLAGPADAPDYASATSAAVGGRTQPLSAISRQSPGETARSVGYKVKAIGNDAARNADSSPRLEPKVVPTSVSPNPPALVDPIIVHLPASYYGATFPIDQDVELVMPTSPRWSVINVTGGRNISLKGGSTVLTSDAGNTVMRFSGASGSVTIRDTVIDVNGHTDDAVNVSGSSTAPYIVSPDVFLINDRILGINTDERHNHGDIFQPQGSIGNLVIENLTGSSNYQGIFIPSQFPIASAYLHNVYLSYEPCGQSVTYLLWIRSEKDHGAGSMYPVTLDNVWVQPRPNQNAAADAVEPRSGDRGVSGTPIGAIDGGSTVSWPISEHVVGVVHVGQPTSGDPAQIASRC